MWLGQIYLHCFSYSFIWFFYYISVDFNANSALSIKKHWKKSICVFFWLFDLYKRIGFELNWHICIAKIANFDVLALHKSCIIIRSAAICICVDFHYRRMDCIEIDSVLWFLGIKFGFCGNLVSKIDMTETFCILWLCCNVWYTENMTNGVCITQSKLL